MLYFLQHVEPPILPPLRRKHPASIVKNWDRLNQAPLPVLLKEFFAFYEAELAASREGDVGVVKRHIQFFAGGESEGAEGPQAAATGDSDINGIDAAIAALEVSVAQNGGIAEGHGHKVGGQVGGEDGRGDLEFSTEGEEAGKDAAILQLLAEIRGSKREGTDGGAVQGRQSGCGQDRQLLPVLVIEDPLTVGNNVARGVSVAGWSKIAFEFQRAKLLVDIGTLQTKYSSLAFPRLRLHLGRECISALPWQRGGRGAEV